MEHNITLRPAEDEDAEFLFRVFVSARQAEFELHGWTYEQANSLLTMQFRAQTTYYATHFVNSDFLVILWGGQPVGRLCLDRNEDRIHIVDLALLPEYRNRGIGTALLQQVLAEAAEKPVTLHVERHNRAINLYTRLGFVMIDETEIDYLMERRPAVAMATAGDI